MFQIDLKKISLLVQLKILFLRHMLLVILMPNKFSERLRKRIAKNEKNRIEKVIKRKDDNLHITQKGYDNSFNSWIDK